MKYTNTFIPHRNNNVIPHLMRNLLLAVAAMTTISCTANYLEINTNPYEVSKEQMATDGYDVGAAITALCGAVVSPDVNTAQFTDCLLGGPMGGYYSSTGWKDKTIDNFDATDEWTRVFMASDRVVPTLFSNLAELEAITDDPVILAIAKVIKVTAMHRVTDTYGAIPYSKIEVGSKLKVPYDSQQKVYETMFAELDEAIEVLSENSNSSISANADPVYGGNVGKWCRFANSLKLRLAMRTVYVKDFNGKDRIKEVFADNSVGVMASNEDNAALKAVAFGDKGNPLYTAVKYNQVQGSQTGGDTHAAADIIYYMNAYEDPRRDAYFTESEVEEKYVGLRVSVKKPSLTDQGRKYSGVKLSPSDPVMWMNAAEVAFLKAEAEAVFDIDIPGGAAEDFYNEGIRLSFEQWGASGAEKYIQYTETDKEDEDNYKVPGAYTDPIVTTNSYSEPLTALSVKWQETDDKAAKQERIMIQKWIANYHLGNEAWADHRRTGYPVFFPSTAEGNNSGGTVDNVLGARRMPYPQAENTNNTANYQEAVSQWLNGKDDMGQRIWWDCNPDVKK